MTRTMRIAIIEVFEYRAPFARPEGNGVTLWRERRAVLLRVTTNTGAVGLGEGWAPANGIDPLLEALVSNVGVCLGSDGEEAARRLRATLGCRCPDWTVEAALGALDLAWVDAQARERGVPLWSLLTGDSSGMAPRVAVYASGGLYAADKGLDDLAGEMAAAIGRGFTTVKMKVGALPLEQDLARIAAVRTAVGSAKIVVDALSGLPFAEAAARITRFANAGACAVQAPIGLESADQLVALAASAALPIWIGEASADIGLFDRVSAAARPAWIQLNPARVGGISTARTLARRYRRQPPGVTLQCHATAVLQTACLHLAAASADVAHAEFHLFHRHLHEWMPAALHHVIDGVVTLGAEPGLGITLPDHDSRLRLVARMAV